MPPNEMDMARMWDMLDAARAAMEFTRKRRYEDLLEDRLLRSGVERSLEIVGEAAKRVTIETRESLTEIPWRAIIGLRNVLAHEYDAVRQEILWRICQNELPLLVERLLDVGVDDPPEEGPLP